MALSTDTYDGGRLNAATELKALVFGAGGNAKETAMARSLVRAEIEKAYREGLVMRPPWEPSACAAAIVMSTRLGVMVRKMARNTVGLGLEFPVKAGVNPSAPEVLAEAANLARFFSHASYRNSIAYTAYLVHVDMHGTGRGYYEWERNEAGELLRVSRAFALQIRPRCDNKGVVRFQWDEKQQMVTRTFLKWFGLPGIMDAGDGQIYEPAAFPRGKQRANEVIARTLDSVFSPDQGVPWWIAARDSAISNYDIQQQNRLFVLNAGQYRFAVAVENGELDAESIAMLKEFVRSDPVGQDVAENGGVIVLQTGRKQAVNRTNDVRIRITPLQQATDGAFSQLRRDNNDDQRESFGLSGVFIGDDAAGARAGTVMRQMAIEEDFAPITDEEDFLFSNVILPAMGVKYHRAAFVRPSAIDHVQASQILGRFEPTRVFTYRDLYKLFNTLVPKARLKAPDAWWADYTPVQIQTMIQKSPEPAQELLDNLAKATAEMKAAGFDMEQGTGIPATSKIRAV